MSKKTIDEWFEDFNDFRKNYGLSTVDSGSIKAFINWCHRTHPEESYLTQETLDEWGPKRDGETNITHASRTGGVNRLLKFMNQRGESFQLIKHEPVEPTAEPRIITEEEFKNILRAADELKTVGINKKCYLRYQTRALEMPVMIRLLYSSGIRPPEARLLDRRDLDTDNGILYVRKGKGYKERFVALDPDMNELLKKYDEKMEEIMPGRFPLFPDEKGEYRTAGNLGENWRILCDKYNKDTKPGNGKKGLPIYTLRHHYITTNIEKLPQDGWNKDIRLIAISQSAGHSNVETTIKHYFHLTARSGELIDEKMGDVYDDIIPDIEDPKNEKEE